MKFPNIKTLFNHEIAEGGYISINESVLQEKALQDHDDIISRNIDVINHPYDYNITRGLYKQFGLVSGIIDKYADHIIGSGFHVTSKNKRAQEVITQYIKDNSLVINLKEAFKEALITGTGSLEIKNAKTTPEILNVINSTTLFKKKNGKGYKQILSGKVNESVEFKDDEIVTFFVNKMPGMVYGHGLIWPCMKIIDNYLKSDKDLHKLMERKANSPIHVKIGDAEKRIIPSQASIDAYGKKLHYMRNVTEWCTDPYVEMKVLDFGNVGEKFDFVMRKDFELILYGFQIPEVILGSGNIPEGLGKVQLDVWDRTIQGFREDFEKVIEERLFKPVLLASGLVADVDVVWNKPGEQARQQEITQILETLKLFNLSPTLRILFEQRLAELMNLEYKPDPDEEREDELSLRVPQVPGQNAVTKSPEECSCGVVHESEDVPEILKENVKVSEWVGYNYSEHVKFIEEFLDSEEFVNREFKTFSYIPGTDDKKWQEFISKYSLKDNLSEKQISKLRNVLKFGFRNNSSMGEIISDVKRDVNPDDLTINVPEVLDDNGEVVRKGYERTISGSERAISLARTETIRAANQGSLKKYKSDDVEKVSWVSAFSDRTCEFCAAQNGKVMEIKSAMERIPAHQMCRCSWIPVVRT